MTKLMFTEDELSLFQARFEENKNWKQWVRVTNCDGLDILSLDIEGRDKKTVRMTKKEGQGYLAKCVDEWGLAVAHDFESLLNTVDEGTDTH
ncbi:hypothetical protein MTBPR1_60051 [Candidatus Terasakiella magnetica]|uniref:Uncharacterized protein n=1 Tax=Candidatus Terasakiella magnetica TaxID=1867952 RepID=A0A1C3RJU0_9PROT|nr:hypothetical protein [Candidatus Terasakiella magnetica]SCA57538.1 hypothetical protein MTBPR1_60051 [Candidatus Terasakiella magnetica]